MAVVASNEPAGTGLRRITFHHTPPGYDRPGQFVTLHVGDARPAYFALASSPGEPAELLVKVQGEVAERIASLVPGDEVEMSAALGEGYALERVAGLELVILVNGSGISSIRPVVRALLAETRRPLHLLYGVMTPAHRGYADELEAWARAGVDVHTVVDSPEGTGWEGRTGFVQDSARALDLVRADVGVILCGVPAMVEAARSLYTAAGVPADRILTNF
jgi:NAD(P)H-flavin reductase